VQIFFATLPNGSGENSAQAFFPSIAFPAELRSFPVSQSSKYVEIRSRELFQLLGIENGGRKDVESVQRACVHDFTTAVVTHPFHKLLARFLNQ
jgi:hypothetical protein